MCNVHPDCKHEDEIQVLKHLLAANHAAVGYEAQYRSVMEVYKFLEKSTAVVYHSNLRAAALKKGISLIFWAPGLRRTLESIYTPGEIGAAEAPAPPEITQLETTQAQPQEISGP